MIINNLPYMINIGDSSNIIKGKRKNNDYDNKAGALAVAYAESGDLDNVELRAASLTFVYIEPGLSQARSSSEAEVFTIPSL